MTLKATTRALLKHRNSRRPDLKYVRVTHGNADYAKSVNKRVGKARKFIANSIREMRNRQGHSKPSTSYGHM